MEAISWKEIGLFCKQDLLLQKCTDLISLIFTKSRFKNWFKLWWHLCFNQCLNSRFLENFSFFSYLQNFNTVMVYSWTSTAWTGLGSWKIVLAKGSSSHPGWIMHRICLFVLLLYVPSQQLWSWRDSQFTTTLFPGQAWSNKQLTSTSCTYFRLSSWMIHDHRNYFMINLHESMGLGQDLTPDPWICSQTHIYAHNGLLGPWW